MDLSSRTRFIPFDPSMKRSEAVIAKDRATLRVVKGAPSVVSALAEGGSEVSQDVEALASQGYRVLAVASGTERVRMAGLLAMLDPPRPDWPISNRRSSRGWWFETLNQRRPPKPPPWNPPIMPPP